MVTVFVRENLPFNATARPGVKTKCSVCPQLPLCAPFTLNRSKALPALRSQQDWECVGCAGQGTALGYFLIALL